MEKAQCFVSEYRTSSRKSVLERRCYVFRLFRKYVIAFKDNEALLEEVTSNLGKLSHETVAERILFVEFLIYFKQFDQLLHEFTSGEGLLISKIAKQNWFFVKMFEDVKPQHFVEIILPTMPFVVRMKILRKLQGSEEQCGEVFDAVYRRYGLHAAHMFLEKCSVNKIKYILQEYSVKLTVNQLKVVYNKDPNLIEVYFEERAKFREEPSSYHPLLIYIAQKNPDLFCKLKASFIVDAKLGRRTTKSFVQSKKREIVSKPMEYFSNLNSAALVRKLGPYSKDLYYHVYLEQGYIGIPSILKYYPKKRQFDLYRSTHDQIYLKKFGEDVDNIGSDIFRLILDPEEREKWAQLKFEKNRNDDGMKYFKAERCFEKVMEKLDVTDRFRRAMYVGIATESCIINNDLETLLKVGKLVAFRLKNDDDSVRTMFFSPLSSKKYITDQFTHHHWQIIIEILSLMEAKGEFCWDGEVLLYRCLESLFKKGKPMKDLLLKLMKEGEAIKTYHVSHNKALHRAFLLSLIDLAPERFTDEKCRTFDLYIVEACRKYNYENPKEVIDIYDYPRLTNSLKSYLNLDRQFTFETTINYAITRFYRDISKDAKVEELLKLYLRWFEVFGTKEVLIFLLKYRISLIEEYFEDIFKAVPKILEVSNIKNNQRLWGLFKKYAPSSIVRKAIDSFLLQLRDETFSKPHENVLPLSHLMPVSEFLKLEKTYRPTLTKVDLKDEAVRRLYQIQGIFAVALRNLKSYQVVLPIIMDYCAGDFMAYAITPLYKAMYRVPEILVRSYVDRLDNAKSLSASKHATHLSCQLLDQKTATTFLTKSPLPKLLTVVLSYFVKNASSELFDLLQSIIRKAGEKDHELLETAISTNVPVKYRKSYYQALWEALLRLDHAPLKQTFVSRLNKFYIEQMSPELCRRIIEDSFFNTRGAVTMTATYVLYCSDYSFTLKYIKSSMVTSKQKGKVMGLVKEIFTLYMTESHGNENFADTFTSIFKTHFSETEFFEAHILVQLMKYKNKDFQTLSAGVLKLSDEVVAKHGHFLDTLFIECLQNPLKYFFTQNFDTIEFCYHLLKLRTTAENAVLVIQLLPKGKPDNTNCVKYYNDCLALLSEFSEDYVKTLLNHWFNK